jgi:hypothetical protein
VEKTKRIFLNAYTENREIIIFMIFLKNKKKFAKNNLRLIRQIQSTELEEEEMSWLLNT